MPHARSLPAVDSIPTRFAFSSYSSLSRDSFEVGGVCVGAPIRICAGAISDGRSYRDTGPLNL